MEITEHMFRRRGRLRRWLGGGPPSLRAALFLSLSTFLSGCVLAALLFVGIWRHTAGEVAHTRAAQQSDQRQLLTAHLTLAKLQGQLARNRRLLDHAEQRAAQELNALEHARTSGQAVTRALTPRLQQLVDAAAGLARQTATIQSELTALESYARQPGAGGVDGAYLATQARYLVRSAAAAAAGAADLARSTLDAQAKFTTAGRSSST